MQRITSAFAVAFLGANLFAALGACGPSAITGWFVVQQLVQMGVVVSVPVVMRSVVRDHVKASCDSQDSDSLACPGRNHGAMLSSWSSDEGKGGRAPGKPFLLVTSGVDVASW